MDYKEKCKLIYKYRNDSYMVVLNDEYRYDGSLVVEADNALELEAKLNKVERIDRTYSRDRLGRFAPKGMGSGVAAAVVSVGGKNVISGTEAARDYKVTGFDKSVQKAYDKARKAEPAITRDMVRISGELGMEMEGLKFSVKTGSSVAGKILRKIRKDETPVEMVNRMQDIVRYTQMGKHEDLALNTGKTIKALEKKGYQITKVENKYLDKSSDYKGIHLDVTAPSGQKFELQIHSKESMAVKNKIHPIYETSRKLPDGNPDKVRMQNEMRSISSTLKMPKNIESLKDFP